MSLSLSLHFTAHHNWAWVVREAMQRVSAELCGGDAQCVTEHASFKALPHSRAHPELRAKYSLFRLDVVTEDDDDDEGGEPNVRAAVRVTSPSLSFMDPKDLLFRELCAVGAERAMPRTVLIPCEQSPADRERTLSALVMPSRPALLKAPLGSGGFGLYFVFSPFDVEEVLRTHQLRAQRERRTLDSVTSTFAPYADAPLCWSLQALVAPRCVDVPPPPPGALEGVDIQQYCKNRRTQVRAYVVECEGELYVYDVCEVRCPLWDEDIDALLRDESERYADGEALRARGGRESSRVWAEAVEEECCGRGAARPYNAQRAKHCTDRFLLRELDTLRDVEEDVLGCVIDAFGRLKRRILQFRESDAPRDAHAALAIMGVDLLVGEGEGDAGVAIVEVNNNPAMPADKKRMSAKYRAHLVDLGLSLALLGLRGAGLSRPQCAPHLARFRVIPDLSDSHK